MNRFEFIVVRDMSAGTFISSVVFCSHWQPHKASYIAQLCFLIVYPGGTSLKWGIWASTGPYEQAGLLPYHGGASDCLPLRAGPWKMRHSGCKTSPKANKHSRVQAGSKQTSSDPSPHSCDNSCRLVISSAQATLIALQLTCSLRAWMEKGRLHFCAVMVENQSLILLSHTKTCRKKWEDQRWGEKLA